MYRPKDSWGGRPTDDLGHLRRENDMDMLKKALYWLAVAMGSMYDPAGAAHIVEQQRKSTQPTA